MGAGAIMLGVGQVEGPPTLPRKVGVGFTSVRAYWNLASNELRHSPVRIANDSSTGSRTRRMMGKGIDGDYPILMQWMFDPASVSTFKAW